MKQVYAYVELGFRSNDEIKWLDVYYSITSDV